MKKYINAALSITSVLMLFYIIYDQRQQLAVYKGSSIDSLQVELFNAQNNVGRYEIALELLAQQDEPAAAKFDSLYKHETE